VLVQLQNVSKSFGAQSVLRDLTFQINPTEKIGLIGGNGAGKSTLLKLITGMEEPDQGVIHRKSGLLTGSLDQIPDFHDRTTVLDEALQSFRPLLDSEKEMRSLEQQIAADNSNDAHERYSHLQHAFELRGGYSFRARTEGALLGVGFRKSALDQSSASLSGGEKNRLALARLLLSESELLLLDEPTNHLDIRSIEWLERFLTETSKTILVVSHDRFFLDRVATRILEVNGGRVEDYRGNYSAYLRERAERFARQQKEWALQKEWIENQEDYIRRNIAGQKTKQAQSRRKLLARLKPIERPRNASSRVTFRFLPVERSSRSVLRTRGLSIGYDRPLVENLQFEVQRGERWAILGGNGSGKTTMLRTIVGQIPPISGELEWSETLDFGYYDQQLGDLRPESQVLDEIRGLDNTSTDGELRGYLAQFLFSGDDIFKKVGDLSGGEKSRLALAKIIYQQPQLLALDEPTNHLDISSREALEEALLSYPGTILFVTHDRYLAGKIATHLLYIEGGRAYLFDRLSAFEEWLNDRGRAPEAGDAVDSEARTERAPSPAGMSKNRREKLQSEIAQLEAKITGIEGELAELETTFSKPDPLMNWEDAHRRYATLKASLDQLYIDLAERSDLIS
jgi:ATP-binding cassette subfamily F protein 3